MAPSLSVDWASVDRNKTPDFDAAKRANVRCAIMRAIYGRPLDANGNHASSGPPFRDPTWKTNKDAVVKAGLKRGAYLFVCFPKDGIYTPTPEEQANAFVEYVGALDSKTDIVPFFDVEASASLFFSAEEMFEWCLRVAERLRACYRAWPGLYSSARVWAENLKHHPPGQLLNCPLWLAKPWPWAINTPGHMDGAPSYSPTLIPEFGSQYFGYQYQGDATKVPGFSNTVDLSRWRVFGEGSKGAHVIWVQKRIDAITDGIFGPNTKAALVLFQKAHGLAADGVVGLDTFSALSWVLPT